MSEALARALHALTAMKHPSVASLLRRNGYEYEAQQIEQLIRAWEQQQGATRG